MVKLGSYRTRRPITVTIKGELESGQLKINIFETLAKEFYDDEAVLNAWAKESIFVSNLLTDREFKATKETVTLLKARIQKSKDDSSSALTNDLADRLLVKVADIEALLV